MNAPESAATDMAQRHPDKEERKRHQAFVDLMIPVVKGWSTETGIEVASLGVQVHGGMGFIEETGAEVAIDELCSGTQRLYDPIVFRDRSLREMVAMP